MNPLFPAEAFAKAGYVHQAINGQKGYHGVAILSKRPFAKQDVRSFCGKDDTRHICVTFEDGLELHNFYVPAGGDIPDPAVNVKFAHKLDFLREMTWPGDIRIESAFHALDTRRMQMRQRLYQGETLVARASSTLAVIDTETRRAVALTEEWLIALGQWLVPAF